MTESNYRILFGLIVSGIVRPWEATIRGLKFTEVSSVVFLSRSMFTCSTQLGALRYDRDLRTIVSYLSAQTPLGVGQLRDSFARLQQIASLLTTSVCTHLMLMVNTD